MKNFNKIILPLLFLITFSNGAQALDAGISSPADIRDQIEEIARKKGVTAEALSKSLNTSFDSLGLVSEDLPSSGYNKYELVGAGFSTSFSSGCNGVGLPNILGNLNGQLDNVLTYIQSNALNLAINYLIFSNPTLYELFQDMKESTEFAIDLNLATCQSVRALAVKDKEILQKAIDKCIADKGTPEACNDGHDLSQYAETELSDIVSINATGFGFGSNGNPGTSGANGSPGSTGPTAGITGNGTGTGVSTDGSHNSALLAKAAVPDVVKEHFNNIVPDIRYNGDKIEHGGRKTSLSQIVNEKQKLIFSLLDKAVDAYTSNSDFNTFVDQINDTEGGGKINKSVIHALASMKESEKTFADYILSSENLARSISISHGMWIGSAIGSVIANGTTSGQLASKMTDDARSHYDRSQKFLIDEMQAISLAIKAQDYHLSIAKDVVEKGSNARARKIRGEL